MERELSSQIQFALIAKSIGDNVVVVPFIVSNPAGHVPPNNIEIGVPPMGVVLKVVGKDVTKCGFVLDQYVGKMEDLAGDHGDETREGGLH